MAVMAVCVALVVIGGIIVFAWGDSSATSFRDAYGGERPLRTTGGRSRASIAVRSAGVAIAAGLVAGVIAAGAGGRLVMRLLGATSPDAEGAITEADEIVGRITVEGTLGFFVFVGISAGLLTGALYALLWRVLPPGRAGGVAFGALLLVLVGTRIEPLRPSNPDFDLVGPPWLAVLAFVALGIFDGMLVAALAERMSPTLAPGGTPRFDGGGRGVTLGRIAVVAISLAALPLFIIDIVEILNAAG